MRAIEFEIPPLFHLSRSDDLSILRPAIPEKLLIRKNDFEESKTPRVSFAETIDGCILGLQLSEHEFKNGSIEYNVYVPIKIQDGEWKSNDDIISEKLVFDAEITKEWWCLSDIQVKMIGSIRIYNKVKKTIEYTPIRIGNPKFLKPNGKLDTYLYYFKRIK